MVKRPKKDEAPKDEVELTTVVRWQEGKAWHMVGWDTEGEPLILILRPDDKTGGLYMIGEQRGPEAKRQLLELIKRVVFR